MKKRHSLNSTPSVFSRLLGVLLLILQSLFVTIQAQTTVLNISNTVIGSAPTTGIWTNNTGSSVRVRITAKGARGGARETSLRGFNGATIVGTFVVPYAQTLYADAGAEGKSSDGGNGGGYGGSGSGVRLGTTYLIIAAGGGATGNNGSTGGSGGNSVLAGLSSFNASGGTNGSDGGNPVNNTGGKGGKGVFNGYAGGQGGTIGGAGGGGYNGGGGANTLGGGGGGSLNAGCDQTNTAANNAAGGSILIENMGSITGLDATFIDFTPSCTTPNTASIGIRFFSNPNAVPSDYEYANVSGPAFLTSATFTDLTNTLGFTVAATTSGAIYTVRVRLKSDPCNYQDYTYTKTSANVLSVTTQPSTATACVNTPLTLTTKATIPLTEFVTIKWQRKRANEGSYSNITDPVGYSLNTDATYTFTPLETDNGTMYRAAFVSSCGSTYSNAVTFTANLLPPVTTNNALNLNGTNNYVKINKCGSGTIFPGGDAITIEYRFKTHFNGNIQSVIRMQNNSDYITPGWTNNSSNNLPKHIISSDGGINGGINVANSIAQIYDGNWHHIAMTWQLSGHFTSYFDGVQVAQRTASSNPLPTFSTGVFLGTLDGTREFTNGMIDDIRVWTVVRTPEQILNNMCALQDQSSLLMNYTFDHGVANSANIGINGVVNSANTNDLNGSLVNVDLSTTTNWVTGAPNYANNITTTTHPSVASSYCVGSTATLTASATQGANAGGMTVQWQYQTGGDPLFYNVSTPTPYGSGGVATYTTAPLSMADEGKVYRAVFRADCATPVLTNPVTLTILGGVSPLTTNNALNFDGSDDYVQIKSCGGGTLFPGGDALTIEYWFKGTSNQSAVRMQVDNSKWIVAGWNGQHILSNDGGLTGISVGTGYTDGNWHHIAMTWQRGGLFTSYLDGVQVAQKVASNTPLPAFDAGVCLGGYNGTSEFMNGSLDEVRVWMTARTPAEIQADRVACNITPQLGLLMSYKFDHGVANNSNLTIKSLLNSANTGDFIGLLNNFDLTNTNSNSNWTTGQDIIIPPITTNNALSFDGANDYVAITNCANVAVMGNPDALTIEYWFKGTHLQSPIRFQAYGNVNTFIVAGWTNGNVSNPPRHILSNDGGINNGIKVANSAADIYNNGWHHIAMTWEQGGFFTSYFDGEQIEQRNASNDDLPAFNANLFLGSYGGVSEFMNGSLDEVRVWNLVRTQAEIQANRLGCNTVSGQAGLVLYYQFNHGTAESNNGNISALSNSANATTFPAVLQNFALSSPNSNWVASPLCTNIYTWTGSASTDWANLSNWSPTVVPLSTSSIIVPTTPLKLLLTENHSINQLSFSGNSKILLGNYNLTLNNLTGGSPTSYIVTNGTGSLTLKDIGTTTTLFPVGPSETVYAPATITNTINRDFTVRVGTTLTNAAALPNSVGLQWEVTPSVSTGNSATLAFGWSSGSQLTGFNPNTGVQIAHYNGTTWDNFRMATVSGSNPYTATVTGVEVFSPFIVTNQMALPVELLSFKGQFTEGGNLLTWQTANEVNNKGFQIERAPQPPKGASLTWEILGFVAAKGKAATYDFLDATPPLGGGGLYRLRQMDNDGKETLSKTISITMEGKQKLSIYPNPVSNLLTINALAGDYQIINLLGQVIRHGKKPSLEVEGIDVSTLANGTYFLRMGTEQVRFVKQ